jgi:hypothetical protein
VEKKGVFATYHAAEFKEAGKKASEMTFWLEEKVALLQKCFEVTAPDGLDVEYMAVTPTQIIVVIKTHGESDIGLQKKTNKGAEKIPELIRFESSGNFIVLGIEGQIYEIYYRARK